MADTSKFTLSVYRPKDGKDFIYMDYSEYVPFDDIDSMHAAGYRFMINKKKVPLAAVKALRGKDLHNYNPDNPDATPEIGKSSNQTTPKAPPAPKAVDAVEEVEQPKKEPIRRPTPAGGRGRAKRQVKCVDDGKIYNSMSEAAKAYGIDPAAVSYSVNTGKPTKKKGGYYFQSVEE